MSQKDRQTRQAQLDADPALQAAWEAFRGTLSLVSGPLTEDQTDLVRLRAAAERVGAEAGEARPRH